MVEINTRQPGDVAAARWAAIVFVLFCISVIGYSFLAGLDGVLHWMKIK